MKFNIFFSLLSKKFRIAFFLIIFFSSCVALLELISIGLVYPLLLNLLSDKNDNQYINLFFQKLGISTLDNKYVLILFILLILAFVIKNFLNIFLNFFSLKFSTNLFIDTSEKYFISQLSSSYEEFISNESGKIIKNIREIPLLFKGYTENLINLFAETLILISVSGLLFIVNFKVALAVFCFFCFFLAIYQLTFKKKSAQWGKDANFFSGQVNQVIINFFNSFLELKIFNKKYFFLNKFQNYNTKFAFLNMKNLFVLSITKNIFELIILTLCLIFFFIILDINYLSSSLALVGLYLFSAYRILPAVNKIVNSRIMLSSLSHSLDNLVGEFKKNNFSFSKNYKNKKKDINFLKSIKLKNISFSYQSKEILKLINFNFKFNKIYGITGPSGGGKSTLLKIILNVIKPTSGQIFYNFKNGKKQSFLDRDALDFFSFVPQKTYFFSGTLIENITLENDKRYVNYESFYKSLKFSFLENLVNSLNGKENYFINENSKNFSGGQEQRIALARAIYRMPKILIIDEATNALDKKIELKIFENLKKYKKKDTMIILVTHNLLNLKFCDHVLKIENGLLK